jgi:hypothetical protein
MRLPLPMPNRASLLLHSLLAGACAAAVVVGPGACTQPVNVHDTQEAKSQPCYNCHRSAYLTANTPQQHVSDGGVPLQPTTCPDCHNTTAWIPATSGHAAGTEAKFPITMGSHSRGILCADCHIDSNGSNQGGQNCDCVHCHLGAHNAPGIDGAHAGVTNYTPSSTSPPNFCLTCHVRTVYSPSGT